MEFRSHLLCCACRSDLAPALTGKAYSIGRVTQFIVFIIKVWVLTEILTKKDNFLVMLDVYVQSNPELAVIHA